MPKTKKNNKAAKHDYVICSFQGGGALGAFQAGVLHALDDSGYFPNWFVGTSIGAINAAIAAGNPEKVRIEKMYQFWESIANNSIFDQVKLPDDIESRKMQHTLSSNFALFFGQPGFFVPRFPVPDWGWHKTIEHLSYYDTSPLRATLEKFIDFDRINAQINRLSVGAVEVCTGDMVYFDSAKQKIGPEHIMASGALPPGFPAIEVEGKFYWDGGISSNSPMSYVLSTGCPDNSLCFLVHLFDSYGLKPTTIDEVMKRKKDIEFSSRLSKFIELYKQIHTLKSSIHLLSKYIPKEVLDNPELKICLSRGDDSTVTLVRFMYEEDGTELSTKDYEFSKKTVIERLQKGYQEGKEAIKESPWLNPIPATEGFAIYDMSLIHRKG